MCFGQAPELVDDPEGMAARGWGPEVDMWAVGILLFYMLAGVTPFDDRTIPRVLYNVQRGRCGDDLGSVHEAGPGIGFSQAKGISGMFC